MPATDQQATSRKHKPGSNVRHRQEQVSVRLSPQEYAAVKAMAARDGLSLPGALREGFLRYAVEAG